MLLDNHRSNVHIKRTRTVSRFFCKYREVMRTKTVKHKLWSSDDVSVAC